MNEPLEATGSVGLGIHLGLLTEQTTRRQHLLAANVCELLKIIAVLPKESTEMEALFSCIRRSVVGLATQWPPTDSQVWLSSPCMQIPVPSIEAWFVRKLWRCPLDEWRRLHFWTKLSLFLLFCGVSRLCSVTVFNSSLLNCHTLGQNGRTT